MAKGFLDTDAIRKSMNASIIPNTAKNLINNPYYLYNDKTATVTTYYNLNTTMTTLDEATRGNYGEISLESPLRFNKITGFYLYGISKIEPSLDITDYGLEGDNVDGEAIILPNTIIPYPGDRFIIDNLGNKYLFAITHVSPNTLETGAIMYKASYTLSVTDGKQDVERQVVKTYRFIANNVGSNFNTLIEDSTYDNLANMEAMSKTLKDYFIQLFYDARIQSVAYYRESSGFKVYDPYLLEFIIRNNVLSGSSNYVFLDHQMFLPNTFGIDYDRTIFSSIDHKDINKHVGRYDGNILLCTQKLSLLYAYPQDYYYMEYKTIHNKLYLVNIFDDPSFGDKIKNNTKSGNPLKDIIIGYFYDEDITDDMINNLSHIEYYNNTELFYLIPIVIYILDNYITSHIS